MPVQPCPGGEKYGKHGKCYKGKGAHAKAVKQGQAIEISKHSGAKWHDGKHRTD